MRTSRKITEYEFLSTSKYPTEKLQETIINENRHFYTFEVFTKIWNQGKKQTIKGIFQHLLFFYTNHSLVLLVYIHHMILH